MFFGLSLHISCGIFLLFPDFFPKHTHTMQAASSKRAIDQVDDHDPTVSAKQVARQQMASLQDFLQAEAKSICTSFQLDHFLPMLLSNDTTVASHMWGCLVNHVSDHKNFSLVSSALCRHPAVFQWHADKLCDVSSIDEWTDPGQLALFKEAVACESIHIDVDWLCKHYKDIQEILGAQPLLHLLVESARMSAVERLLTTCEVEKPKHVHDALVVMTGSLMDSRQMVAMVKIFTRFYQQNLWFRPSSDASDKISNAIAKLPYTDVHYALRQSGLDLGEWPDKYPPGHFGFTNETVVDVAALRQRLENGFVVGIPSDLSRLMVANVTKTPRKGAVDVLRELVTFSPCVAPWFASQLASHPRGAEIMQTWPIAHANPRLRRKWVIDEPSTFLDSALIEMAQHSSIVWAMDFTALTVEQLRVIAPVIPPYFLCCVGQKIQEHCAAVVMARDEEAFATLLARCDDNNGTWVDGCGMMTLDYVIDHMSEEALSRLWAVDQFRRHMLGRSDTLVTVREYTQCGRFPFSLVTRYDDLDLVVGGSDFTKIFDYRRAHYIATQPQMLAYWVGRGMLDGCFRLAVRSKCSANVIEAMVVAGAQPCDPLHTQNIFMSYRDDIDVIKALVRRGIVPQPEHLTPHFSRPCLEALVELLPHPPSQEALCAWASVPETLDAFRALVAKHGPSVLSTPVLFVARIARDNHPKKMDALWQWLLAQFEEHNIPVQLSTQIGCDVHSSWRVVPDLSETDDIYSRWGRGRLFVAPGK